MILKATVSQVGLDRVQRFLKSDVNRVSRGCFDNMRITNIEALVRGKRDFGFESRGNFSQFLPVIRIIRTEAFQYSDATGKNSNFGYHITLEIAEAIRIYCGDNMEIPPNGRVLIADALGNLSLALCETFEIPGDS